MSGLGLVVRDGSFGDPLQRGHHGVLHQSKPLLNITTSLQTLQEVYVCMDTTNKYIQYVNIHTYVCTEVRMLQKTYSHIRMHVCTSILRYTYVCTVCMDFVHKKNYAIYAVLSQSAFCTYICRSPHKHTHACTHVCVSNMY